MPYTISTPSPFPTISNSSIETPKSILHKQPTITPKPMAKSVSQDESSKRPETLNTNMKTKSLDLIHDNWFGHAPLASPESLSEISSISSRTSNIITLTPSIEQLQQRISFHPNDESHLQTPKILRRTPKISGNLSTCADDWQSVDIYNRMGKIFITGNYVPSNSDSSDLSYETASNLSQTLTLTSTTNERLLEPQSKSVDNLDDGHSIEIPNILEQTNSESRICHFKCANCIYHNSNCRCQYNDHTKCVSLKRADYISNGSEPNATATTSSSNSDTYYSAMSSLTGFDSSNSNSLQYQGPHYNREECSTINPQTGLLESHFPVYPIITDDRLSLLQSQMTPTSSSTSSMDATRDNTKRISFIQPIKKNISRKKRNTSNDKSISKNESLPLLINLTTNSPSPTSSNYVKRKRNVYPTMCHPINPSESPTPMQLSDVKGESHV